MSRQRNAGFLVNPQQPLTLEVAVLVLRLLQQRDQLPFLAHEVLVLEVVPSMRLHPISPQPLPAGPSVRRARQLGQAVSANSRCLVTCPSPLYQQSAAVTTRRSSSFPAQLLDFFQRALERLEPLPGLAEPSLGSQLLVVRQVARGPVDQRLGSPAEVRPRGAGRPGGVPAATASPKTPAPSLARRRWPARTAPSHSRRTGWSSPRRRSCRTRAGPGEPAPPCRSCGIGLCSASR